MCNWLSMPDPQSLFVAWVSHVSSSPLNIIAHASRHTSETHMIYRREIKTTDRCSHRPKRTKELLAMRSQPLTLSMNTRDQLIKPMIGFLLYKPYKRDSAVVVIYVNSTPNCISVVIHGACVLLCISVIRCRARYPHPSGLPGVGQAMFSWV